MTEPAPARRWRVPARIETERLMVRCYMPQDVALMDEVIPANREHLIEFLPWALEEPVSTAQRTALVEKFIADYRDGSDFTMGIFTRSGGEYIGGTGYHVRADHLEIGYWLAAHAQGQGLMTEAAGALTRAALQYAFAPFVAICCDPANVRSRGVPQRLGFTLTDTRVDTCGGDNREALAEIWRLTQEGYLDSAASAEPRPALFDHSGAPLAWPV